MYLPLEMLLASQTLAYTVPTTSARTSRVGILDRDIAGADVLDKVVAAMGGLEALGKIDAFTYEANQ